MVFLGIAIATLVSFVVSALLYAVPAVSATISRGSTPRPGLSTAVQIGSVAVRSLIAACLVAGLMLAAPWHGPASGALLGLSLSALPLILLMGGVVHENTGLDVAGIHLLDWVVKLVLIGTIIGIFV
ncbi:DUF1761 family protein [Microbacterium sp. CIAB417]|uniref:DUF1761 family protein n=1 Tax=Microbacterium sp. CIAB417 TaxID=2860287 RepID=UPI001FADAE22|nr:DUF1761 family protein [Microbacterium sp. CIAB417]